MKYVYVLVNSVPYDGDEILGIYSTNEKAKEAHKIVLADKNKFPYIKDLYIDRYDVDMKPGELNVELG